MYKLCFFIFCLTLTTSFGYANEVAKEDNQKVIDTNNRVDLIESVTKDEHGNVISKEYYAYNGNNFPVYVTIRLTKAVNVENHLINIMISIAPDEMVDLGQVKRDKLDQASDWDYNWAVSRYPL